MIWSNRLKCVHWTLFKYIFQHRWTKNVVISTSTGRPLDERIEGKHTLFTLASVFYIMQNKLFKHSSLNTSEIYRIIKFYEWTCSLSWILFFVRHTKKDETCLLIATASLSTLLLFPVHSTWNCDPAGNHFVHFFVIMRIVSLLSGKKTTWVNISFLKVRHLTRFIIISRC